MGECATKRRRDFPKAKGLFWSLNFLIPLLIGVAFYLWLRPDVYLSQYVYNALGHTGDQFFYVEPNALIMFIKNHGSDIMWAYALTIAVIFVLGRKRVILISSFIISVIFIIVIELLQKIGILEGTFDVLDIIFEVLASLMAIIVIWIYTREEKK